MQGLVTALGFLTRLGPARVVEPEELGATLVWFPAVGLVLGLLLAAPAYLGLFQAHPAAQALVWTAMNLLLTRGLHWDGWADLWDGWGSGASGERFWEIVKDSRTGAFGVMGIALGLGAFLLLGTEILQSGAGASALGTLVFAPVLGRAADVVLCASCRELERPGLGQLFIRAATPKTVAVALAAAAAIGLALLPFSQLLWSTALAGAGLLPLIRLARRQGGLNGDFLGAAIIWGELSVLLGWCPVF